VKRLVIAATVLVVIGGTAVGVYAAYGPEQHDVPEVVRAAKRSGRSALLAETRRTCDPARLDAFIDEQQRIVEASPEDGNAWHILAEALLERVLLENMREGMEVGRPMYEDLPQPVEAWLDRATAAIDKARALGAADSESYRIESALWSNRIVGMGSALKYSSRVQKALDRAEELDPANPNVQVSRGVRALLAPRFLGHDPEKALEHLERGMEALPEDERPRVFASMAAWLLGRHAESDALVEAAMRINPANLYAQAVHARMVRGVEQPFAADVTDDEVAAIRAAMAQPGAADGGK